MHSEDDDEEVVKPDRIGSMDPDIIGWQPPDPKTKKRLFQIYKLRMWAQSTGYVTQDEMIAYCMQHYSVERPVALELVKIAIKEIQDSGLGKIIGSV